MDFVDCSRNNGGVNRGDVWSSVDAERRSVVADLESLEPSRWALPSLCAGLSVREVLAHMTVSGAVSGPRWFAGVVRARFDFDQQVHDRLREQLGRDGVDTLRRFAATVGSRVSPPLPRLALLGEMVVHGEDIRWSLGIERTYPPVVLAALLRYYASTDQVVVAKKRVRGLKLEATDQDIVVGRGDVVRGPALALIMAMVGRSAFLPQLSGSGASVLAAK
ncbi:maleylpyruvate isomerase family mycothiol-dependent enzyme [Pseudoclavibacter sp. JSM 162008]|uniref:maleylpyruvate isomerase family mycothiol-dependent enzyme n=1 Tax=Pseudoclavibacter sp. JSM 162008 TaxID=3229855 RepID=UPI0035244D25